jgi:hypothetical protein
LLTVSYRGEAEGVAHGLVTRALPVAEGVVVVAVGDGAGGVGDEAHAAQVVHAIEEALPAPRHRERLVDLFPVAVAGLQHVGSIVFQDDCVAIVDISG